MSKKYDDPVEGRRESVENILGSWALEGAISGERGMAVIRAYVKGELEVDETIAKIQEVYRWEKKLTVADLPAVIYSAGLVFNELSASRVATEMFLRSGNCTWTRSRSDLALLEDLRDVALLTLERVQANTAIDASFVCSQHAHHSQRCAASWQAPHR
ncbi:antitoxin VbhA family protein [Nesterenkonia massiliensis]|uniref:antitoxin VbhA family protein n=1 Tax=Nesterenkonia massiliensis TaxID=1232429 RepID=UPI0003F7111C|nr:antitoxin VbhA family protein [Nesterenkonia massiliensis]